MQTVCKSRLNGGALLFALLMMVLTECYSIQSAVAVHRFANGDLIRLAALAVLATELLIDRRHVKSVLAALSFLNGTTAFAAGWGANDPLWIFLGIGSLAAAVFLAVEGRIKPPA